MQTHRMSSAGGWSDAQVLLAPVVHWAALGMLFSTFSFFVFGQWLLSAEFAAVPVTRLTSWMRARC